MSDMPSKLYAHRDSSISRHLHVHERLGDDVECHEVYVRASELAKAYEAIRDMAYFLETQVASSLMHETYSKHQSVIKTAREQGK